MTVKRTPEQRIVLAAGSMPYAASLPRLTTVSVGAGTLVTLEGIATYLEALRDLLTVRAAEDHTREVELNALKSDLAAVGRIFDRVKGRKS